MAQHPPGSVERPLSSGGDDLRESVLVAPQHPPKDPSVNQACGYVQQIIRGGAHVVQCIMKIGGKIHNSNTTYKVSHANAKAIKIDIIKYPLQTSH